MPPKPISKLKAVAKRATIAISVITTTRKLGSTSGSTRRRASAPSQRTEVTRLFFRPPQEAPGANDQDDRHDREEQHDRHRRKHEDAEGLERAHQKRADEAPGKAAEPSDDDDHESSREHVAVHAERHRHRRRERKSAEPGQPAPEDERLRVEPD